MNEDLEPDHVAIGGYDPVAYFEQGRPVPGDPAHEREHDGMRWRFATREHAQAFAADPTRYTPAFAGHCAFAASLGRSESGDPTRWAIRDGRLFLNSNIVAHLLWRLLPGRIAAGDRSWRSSG